MPDCRSVSISSRSDCDDYCDKLDGGLVAWFDSFGFWQCECVVPGGWDTDKKSWDSWEMTFRCSGSRMIEKKLINNRIRCVTRATSELHGYCRVSPPPTLDVTEGKGRFLRQFHPRHKEGYFDRKSSPGGPDVDRRVRTNTELDIMVHSSDLNLGKRTIYLIAYVIVRNAASRCDERYRYARPTCRKTMYLPSQPCPWTPRRLCRSN